MARMEEIMEGLMHQTARNHVHKPESCDGCKYTEDAIQCWLFDRKRFVHELANSMVKTIARLP
jgi:hypothetical protein